MLFSIIHIYLEQKTLTLTLSLLFYKSFSLPVEEEIEQIENIDDTLISQLIHPYL